MYPFIQKLHSGWAYLALILLVFAIVNALIGLSSNKEFTAKDRKISLFGLVFSHVQLLFGLLLYFVSPLGFGAIKAAGMGEVMKNAALRLTAVEHPMINIIAIVCITIGWSRHKKLALSAQKFKSILIFYAIGTLLILSRIPWQNWFS